MLEGIALKLLAKRPDDRYATASHLIKDFRGPGQLQRQ
jgi:hypothetical protein